MYMSSRHNGVTTGSSFLFSSCSFVCLIMTWYWICNSRIAIHLLESCSLKLKAKQKKNLEFLILVSMVFNNVENCGQYYLTSVCISKITINIIEKFCLYC